MLSSTLLFLVGFSVPATGVKNNFRSFSSSDKKKDIRWFQADSFNTVNDVSNLEKVSIPGVLEWEKLEPHQKPNLERDGLELVDLPENFKKGSPWNDRIFLEERLRKSDDYFGIHTNAFPFSRQKRSPTKLPPVSFFHRDMEDEKTGFWFDEMPKKNDTDAKFSDIINIWYLAAGSGTSKDPLSFICHWLAEEDRCEFRGVSPPQSQTSQELKNRESKYVGPNNLPTHTLIAQKSFAQSHRKAWIFRSTTMRNGVFHASFSDYNGAFSKARISWETRLLIHDSRKWDLIDRYNFGFLNYPVLVVDEEWSNVYSALKNKTEMEHQPFSPFQQSPVTWFRVTENLRSRGGYDAFRTRIENNVYKEWSQEKVRTDDRFRTEIKHACRDFVLSLGNLPLFLGRNPYLLPDSVPINPYPIYNLGDYDSSTDLAEEESDFKKKTGFSGVVMSLILAGFIIIFIAILTTILLCLHCAKKAENQRADEFARAQLQVYEEEEETEQK